MGENWWEDVDVLSGGCVVIYEFLCGGVFVIVSVIGVSGDEFLVYVVFKFCVDLEDFLCFFGLKDGDVFV